MSFQVWAARNMEQLLHELRNDPTPSAAHAISDRLGRFLRAGQPARQCIADYGGAIDPVSASLYPKDGSLDVAPVPTYDDGNCLFRS